MTPNSSADEDLSSISSNFDAADYGGTAPIYIDFDEWIQGLQVPRSLFLLSSTCILYVEWILDNFKPQNWDSWRLGDPA